jgi:rubrerythrin
MLRKIFNLCHSIELAAEEAYFKISDHTEADEFKLFWLDISQDEKRHASYWEQLLELQKKGSVKNPFDNPKLVADELNSMKAKIEEVIDNEHLNSDFSDLILWAYQIEHHMLGLSRSMISSIQRLSASKTVKSSSMVNPF